MDSDWAISSSEDERNLRPTPSILAITGPAELAFAQSKKPTKEITQLLNSLRFTITSLYKMPIRRPAPAARLDGLARMSDVDMSVYQHFDFIYVRDVFKTADANLVTRLSRMITRRRLLIRYRDSHNQRIKQEMIDSEKDVDEFRNQEITRIQPTSSATASTKASIHTMASSTEPKQSSRATTFKLDGNGLNTERFEVQSRPDSLSSSASTQTGEELLMIPPRPKGSNNEELEDFICPYCCVSCHITSPRRWKRHVLSDLEPYVCTFGSCEGANDMFDDREDWYNHELQYHRHDYSCNVKDHDRYTEFCKFKCHMSVEHNVQLEDKVSSSQLSMFLRPTEDASGICPLCTASTSKLKGHLGRHLERIALFALPKHSDIENDSIVNNASGGSITKSQNAQVSLWDDSSSHSNVDQNTPRKRKRKASEQDFGGLNASDGGEENTTSQPDQAVKFSGDGEMQGLSNAEYNDMNQDLVPEVSAISWEYVTSNFKDKTDRQGQDFGINVLFDGGAEASVDIVFVHGLTANAYNTWLYNDKGIRVHWPSDLLRQDLPDARLISFGYDTDIVNLWNPRSHSSLTGHAENMVGALIRERERTNTEDRKILFVGHSLGGLVIEQALSHSRKSVEKFLQKFEQLTVGIVFLGVPHCGADLDAWESFGTRLANIVERPNQDLLGVLKPGSEMLHLVENDFHKILRLRKDEGSEISITCFYEELGVRPIGQLVPLHSAKIKGYPIYAIHANHMDMTKFPNREDPGYDAILGELLRWKKTASTIDRKMPSQWMVPRSASRLYTGREELGKRLAQAFSFDASSDPKLQRTFVIIGRGGTGKSEVCLKFAEDHRSHYWGIFWLDARSIATLEQDYVRMGRQCDIAEPSVANVKSWLARNSRRWLVIIDNADDPERDYSEYIPSGMSGDILFTTRVPECEKYNTVGSEKLDDLKPELARELLYRATDIAENQWEEREKAATAIITILGSHTLAIIQAGAFIKKGLCSLEQYPTVFKQQQGRLLKFHAEQNPSTYGNVYATFEVSAEYLQKSALPEASDALDVLHIIAFMHNSGISETMFQRASEYASKLGESGTINGPWWSLVSHIARLPEYVQGWASFQDRIRWRKACTVLESLSIITVHKNDDSFAISMHSSIHAWAKERQDYHSQCRAWQAAATVVALSCGGRWDFQPFFTVVQAHVRACVNAEFGHYTRTLSDMEAAQIFFQFAYVLYRMRDHHSLDLLVEHFRLRLQNRFKTDHEVALAIKTLTGRVYMEQRRNREAIDVFQDIMEIRSRTQPDDHLDQLCSQHDLASAYRADGQRDKAVQLFEHVVKVQERLAEDHPERLVSQHELARSYRKNGQVNKAIQLLKYVVKIGEKSLAEDDPNRLCSQHELALCYSNIGQSTKAIALLEYIVRVRKASLAEDHPNRLSSQHELARCYSGEGQYTKAIALLEHVVGIEKTSLAEDDPSRLCSQHNLACYYSNVGQFAKAIALLEHVVSVRKTTLAEDDPKLLNSQRWLAHVYRQLGEVPRVEKKMQ